MVRHQAAVTPHTILSSNHVSTQTSLYKQDMATRLAASIVGDTSAHTNGPVKRQLIGSCKSLGMSRCWCSYHLLTVPLLHTRRHYLVLPLLTSCAFREGCSYDMYMMKHLLHCMHRLLAFPLLRHKKFLRFH
jgi:hypothetical protein